jgi:hypothetical protein
MTAPTELHDVYCAWAAQKWGLEDVTEVKFDLDCHGPYSEWTPDPDEYCRIRVTHADGESTYEEMFLSDLVNSVTAFSVSR